MKKTKIVVLLSTYNGDKYLNSFLDSLYSQKYLGGFDIHARDDGSIDNTLEILEKYNNKYGNISILKGKNIGPAPSFVELIRKVPLIYEYYFFADQDDVWLESKFGIIIDRLKNNACVPRVVATGFYVTDEHLEVLKVHKINYKIVGLNNAIVQNIVVGATMCLNSRGMKLVKEIKLDSQNIRMHDWWVYLILSYNGTVEYIDDALIYYRQHGSNCVGFLSKNRSLANLFLNFGAAECKAHNQHIVQVKEFASRINLNIETLDICHALIRNNIFKIIKYFFKNEIVFSSRNYFLYFILVLIFFKFKRKY